ncbi:site-specific integrase, partial [Flavihumibacter sp. CACIAM 22H1]|uniref:site-specific integrase n=1 Tax=Flavihumibacter sp. CACIAM 22H1 TaxID=1812911 RepID=UPI0025B903D5
MSVSVDPFIADFLSYIALEKRYSGHTLRAYEDDLIVFRDFLVTEFEESNLLQASTIMVRSWLSSLKDGKMPLAGATIARKLSTLRSFYKYCLRKKLISVSPVVQLSAPKTAKRLPVYLEEKQAGALLTQPPAGDGWKGLTTRLVLAIFYQTGIRLSELVQIQHQQVNFYQQQLRVWGKGGKERIVPLQPVLLEMITDYENRKKQDWGNFGPKDFLLVTEKGKPVYAKYIYRLVREYLAGLTTLQKKSPHVLRHSFG